MPTPQQMQLQSSSLLGSHCLLPSTPLQMRFIRFDPRAQYPNHPPAHLKLLQLGTYAMFLDIFNGAGIAANNDAGTLQVFCYTGDTAHEEMQSACFDYLCLGGWYSEGPISLLSGLRPSPSVLVMHFFAVAIFGVGRLLLPRPSFR